MLIPNQPYVYFPFGMLSGKVLPLHILFIKVLFVLQEAGKIFQECIASNQSLIHLDLRFTGMPQVFEYTLQQNVEFNDNRHRLRPEKDTEVSSNPTLFSE